MEKNEKNVATILENRTTQKMGLADLKNLQSSLKNRNNNSYNYPKIADNIKQLSENLNCLKFMTEKDILHISSHKSQFVDAKTKSDGIDAKVKKSIRKYFQQLLIDEKSTNAEKSKNAKMQIDILTPYLF
jgi:hypothetical protein